MQWGKGIPPCCGIVGINWTPSAEKTCEARHKQCLLTMSMHHPVTLDSNLMQGIQKALKKRRLKNI